MLVSKMKKEKFFINLFKGVEEKEGYVFTVSDEKENKVVFTLYKKNSYWTLSEYTTGLACGFSGFKNRQYAIDYILQYDADFFYKIVNVLKTGHEAPAAFNKKIEKYKKENAA